MSECISLVVKRSLGKCKKNEDENNQRRNIYELFFQERKGGICSMPNNRKSNGQMRLLHLAKRQLIHVLYLII